MKKTSMILSASTFALALLLASCSQENLVPASQENNAPISEEQVPAVKKESCILGATFGEVSTPQTKTYISDESTGAVSWDADDNISVFSTNISPASNNQFTISDIDAGTATFDGQIECGTTGFAAVYPYTSTAAYADGSISGMVIPTTQSATAGSFADAASISIATGSRTPGVPESGTLNFKNLCAVMAVTIPSNISFASSIAITANSGAAIAGNVTIDCASEEITYADGTSITLNGGFSAGNTYYFAVAPGTYKGGFKFVITTAGGKTYTRTTTKDVVAEAGIIYPLGTLSVVMTDSDFTSSVAISHDVASSILNGSTAKFSASVPSSEFSSLIKSYTVTIYLKDANSNVVRTLSYTGSSVSGVTMSDTNAWPYLPKGNYTYTGTIDYVINNGSKDITRSVNCSGSVTSPAPSGFAIDATLAGYTSYSCYKGTDGQSASASNANNCDNATVYSIGASYKSGIGFDMSKYSSLLAVSSTLDGSAKSGNQGSQSWASHKIGATWSFDGASGTCSSSKTVYVTGLPYNKSKASTDNFKSDWSFSGGSSDWDDGFFKLRSSAYANFKGFYIPASTNVTVYYKMKGYCSTRFVSCTTKLWVAGSTVVSDKITGTGTWTTYESSTNQSFTSSNNTIKMQSVCSSSSWAVSQSQGFYFSAIYR